MFTEAGKEVGGMVLLFAAVPSSNADLSAYLQLEGKFLVFSFENQLRRLCRQ